MGTAQVLAGKHSFDVPVKFRVRGAAEPIQATLLHIAVAGCRMRSWFLMERGTGISFDWRLEDGKLLSLSGVVAARYAPRNGGVGFEYAIALEGLPEADADALAREAAMLARRSASARNFDTCLVDISQFTGYRVPDDFTLTYRIDDPRIGGRIATACDVTGNALRLLADQRLRPNQIIQMQLRLPDALLSVHKGNDDELVVGPMGYRRVPRKYLRRPFEEMKLRGRVVALVKDSRRRAAYEIELLDVDGLAREEIARYIHASQLARLKR
jgi:hypothetical protein